MTETPGEQSPDADPADETAGGTSVVSSRRRFLLAGTATAVGTLAGCTVTAPSASSQRIGEPSAASKQLPTRPDTIFQSDVERTGYWPGESVPAEVRLEWSVPDINTGTHTAAKSSPLFYDGDVLVPADTGTVYSFTADGEQNWESSLVPSQRGTHGTPAVVDDYVFIAGYDGGTYAFDADSGDRLWRTEVADAIGSSPVYYGGIVFVATEFYDPSGGMVGLDATTGEVIWSDNRMTNHAHSITGVDPEVNRFAAGSNDGNLYVWNLETGLFEGTFPTGDDIKGPVCMYNGTAIFGSWDGNLYAVDTGNVTEEWHYDTDHKIMSGPAVHPDSDTVVFGNHGDKAFGLDVTTGEHRWTVNTDGWIIGAITIAGDTALFGSYDTTVYAVDVPSGEVRWTFSDPHGRVSTAPAVHDDDVYVTERADYRNEDEELQESGYLYKLSGV